MTKMTSRPNELTPAEWEAEYEEVKAIASTFSEKVKKIIRVHEYLESLLITATDMKDPEDLVHLRTHILGSVGDMIDYIEN
jgi:hypothetical protein